MLTHPATGKPIPNLPKETKIYIQGSTADLYERIAAESKFSIHRLRITQGKGVSIPNDKGVTVASTELQDGDTIQVKDLGTNMLVRPGFHPIYR